MMQLSIEHGIKPLNQQASAASRKNERSFQVCLSLPLFTIS